MQVVIVQSVLQVSTLRMLEPQNHQHAQTVMLVNTQQQQDLLHALIARLAHTRLLLEPVYHQRAPTAQQENIRMLQEPVSYQPVPIVMLAHTP